MPNSFHCPSCGTPLEPPDDTSISIQCPNCHAIVLVPEDLRRSPADAGLQDLQREFPEITPLLSQVTANSGKLKEMARLAREGKKIEAIKIYREIFGVGLVEAKAAIEQLQATGRLDIPSATLAGEDGISPSDKLRKMTELARNGKKIEAIKIYQELYGVGLVEAKNAIEQLEATGRLDTPSTTTAANLERMRMPGLTEAQVEEIAEILRSKNKIEAIKRYRQITNAGLNEAKNAVEFIEKQPNFVQPGAVRSSPLPVSSTIETPPFPPADIGLSNEKSSGARTFRMIVGILIILMMVAIAVLGLMVFTGH